MDDLIRQAYADGMFDDDSRLAPGPVGSVQSAITTTASLDPTSAIYDPPEELILLSDEDDRLFEPEMPPLPSSPFQQPTVPSRHSSITRPAPITVSLPYTYLSLIRSQSIPSHKSYQDHQIRGCFSSLSSNPRLIKNEFELLAYINDGSDSLQIRLASDLLAQRIGITVPELLTRKNACANDVEKRSFQMDFNDRLKRFGHGMSLLITPMTIRLFADGQMPMVMKIEDN